MALGIVQVAAMLSCSEALLEELVLALSYGLHSEADVELLCSFCQEHEAPPELARLAKRVARPQAERGQLGCDKVAAMFEAGLCHNDAELLKLAEAHLKQQSRRAGRDLEKVAEIIGSKAADYPYCERGYALALEFLGRHPGFYQPMAERLFGGGRRFGAYTCGPKYCRELMCLGVCGLTTGSVSTDSLIGFFRRIATSEALYHDIDTGDCYPILLHCEVMAALGPCLKQLASGVQVQLCGIFGAMPDGHFGHFLREELLGSLAAEARALLAERLLSMEDRALEPVVTAALLDLLGSEAKRGLCHKACIFKPDVKLCLIAAATPELSDEGF